MFVHCVFFWLKPDLNDAGRARFLAGLRSLAQSPNAARVSVLRPARTPRDVVDSSYDYQLLIEFADKAAHDAYQSPADEAHESFVQTFKGDWARIAVYDGLPVD